MIETSSILTRERFVLVPKLVTTLRTYERHQFVADLGAALAIPTVTREGRRRQPASRKRPL